MNYYLYNYDIEHKFFDVLKENTIFLTLEAIDKIPPNLTYEDFFEMFPKEGILNAISETLERRGLGLFSFFNKNDEIIKNIEVNVCFQNNYYFVEVPLSSILGLVNIKEPHVELQELSNLLMELKNKQIAYPLERMLLSISRGFWDTELRVSSDDLNIENEINDFFNKTINESQVLKAWRANLINGIDKTHLHLDNLFSNTPITQFFTSQEFDDLLENKKQQEKKFVNGLSRKDKKAYKK